MAKPMKFVPNRKGIRNVALSSQGVRDLIGKYGEETAARARQESDVDVGVVHAGKSRARTYVGIESAALEAKERILGRALPGGGA